MTPDKETVTQLNRWFAIECNNAAWDFSDKQTRSAEEDRAYLATAYASAWHWDQIGAPVNRVRADLLLSQAHADLGEGRRALTYAQSAVDALSTDGISAWDRAFAHLVLARAAAVDGQNDLARTSLTTAEALGHKLEDSEERSAFATLCEAIRDTKS